MNELVYRATEGIQESLENTPPSILGFADLLSSQNLTPEVDSDGNPIYPQAQREIEEGVLKLETLLEATIDKNFDKLEIYVLRNILTVPEDLVPWIRLPHYEGLELSGRGDGRGDGDVPVPTLESVRLLATKLRETRRLNTALEAERAKNASLLDSLRAMMLEPSAAGAGAGRETTQTKVEQQTSPQLSHSKSIPPAAQTPFSFLTTTNAAITLGVGTQQKPLTTNVSFTLSQLPALRSLLSELRPKLTTLSTTTARESDKSRERRSFVDGQVRRGLERRGWVGEWDMGEGDVPGRRIGADELRSLEGVARVFEDRGQSGRDEGEDVVGE